MEKIVQTAGRNDKGDMNKLRTMEYHSGEHDFQLDENSLES